MVVGETLAVAFPFLDGELPGLVLDDELDELVVMVEVDFADRLVVEFALSEAGLTASVGETLTVAFPTSTVKYEPTRGVPSFADAMYFAKLRVNSRKNIRDQDIQVKREVDKLYKVYSMRPEIGSGV